MLVSDFDFDLPEAQIAQQARPRGESRLLVVRRAEGTWREHAFADLPSLLSPGDLMVANDTRVFPARLLGRRDPSGGAVECLLLERESPAEWQALVHPGQKLKAGARVVFDDETRAPGVRIEGEVLERLFFGRRLVRLAFTGAPSLDEAIDAVGHVPLPPYIHRADNADDRERYQTVFARDRGSIAAPTAGLHFNDATLQAVGARGIGWCTVTLHVGYGTFKPVRVDLVEEHRVDPERYSISTATSARIRETRARGSRVVAVGTTTTRALESAAGEDGAVRAGSANADLFIYPGHQFKIVDALVTNFHLPKSSLLMLVAAFAGRDLTLNAYRFAVAEGFHFYSYGDAMLIL
ncbi:MAG TPA: tRNA preQ1(34) S-adenosylmethionine ribosyltransferase-isomerase QueA [Vicinamibacterales bacterium]|nr:tRNA preQ1(34) S-adenosylmethionine ribosyltransferase-isomerase QueA [Vicinamibacterales bacterium]